MAKISRAGFSGSDGLVVAALVVGGIVVYTLIKNVGKGVSDLGSGGGGLLQGGGNFLTSLGGLAVPLGTAVTDISGIVPDTVEGIQAWGSDVGGAVQNVGNTIDDWWSNNPVHKAYDWLTPWSET